MADLNTSLVSQWLWQAHYVRRAFDPRLQRHNGPLL